MSLPIRDAIIAGNWKMNYGPKQASAFTVEIVQELGQLLNRYPYVLSVLCPPAVSLMAVREVLDAYLFRRIELGAQNLYYEEKGAFTGEISPAMSQNSVLLSSWAIPNAVPFLAKPTRLSTKRPWPLFAMTCARSSALAKTWPSMKVARQIRSFAARSLTAWPIYPQRKLANSLSPTNPSGQSAPGELLRLKVQARSSA